MSTARFERPLTRRRLLTLGGLGLGVVISSGCTTAAPAAPALGGHTGHTGHGGGTPSLPPAEPGTTGVPFTQRLVIPPDAQPLPGGPAGVDTYRVTAAAGQLELVPGTMSSTLTYDGRFVGPTVRAVAGRHAGPA